MTLCLPQIVAWAQLVKGLSARAFWWPWLKGRGQILIQKDHWLGGPSIPLKCQLANICSDRTSYPPQSIVVRHRMWSLSVPLLGWSQLITTFISIHFQKDLFYLSFLPHCLFLHAYCCYFSISHCGSKFKTQNKWNV